MKFSNSTACPVAESLVILNNPWKFLIVRSLANGPLRFGKLKEEVVGISPKVLTGCLNDLVEDGILTRTMYAEIPPRTEYELTELGSGFIPVIMALARWGLKYQETNAARAKEAETAAADQTV